MHSLFDIRRLRYFVAIVENGSFSEAARVLNIAQPAMSHHLREMEYAYGHPLLIRSRTRVRLTPAGSILFQCAKDVIARLDQASVELDEWRRAQTTAVKSFRLGIISSLSSALTPRLLSLAARENPRLHLHISEKSVHECHELISEGKLDFAVTLDSLEWKRTEQLFLEELFFVTAALPEPDSDRAVEISQLADQPLILPSTGNSVLRPNLEALARRSKITLTVALEIDGLSPRKEAVIAGLGATVLPIVSIATELKAGILTARPFVPAMKRPIIMKVREGIDSEDVSAIKNLIGRVVT
jgi:LysR family transcriptional regulator, nitrogen assimilation regulatory protein